ncbi:hypothetical protein [Pseudomonas sp. 2FE]|uniref:hypothetical protein n=1 Tax=Pseudomonas sp. 2FE TaxID=2502190 RepID=UPI0010F85437|nr:hypothetical protein [Pseudomonas sp. 2FE]
MKIFSYRYLPLNVYFAYSLFVLMSLLLAPIEYKDIDYSILVSYLVGLVILFSIGYIFGARGSLRNSYPDLPGGASARYFSYLKVRRLLFFLLAFGLVSAVLQWYFFISSGGELSLSSIGGNYVKGYEGYERGQAKVDLTYILGIFDQALSVLTLLFAIYYYRFMGRFSRIALVFIISSYLLINVIGTGKQKYLGDIVIFLAYCAMINVAARGVRFRLSSVFVSMGVAFLVFFMFIEILRQRYVAAGIGLDNIYEKSHPLISWDESSVVFDIFGGEYGFALGIFLGYFTNGLYGLYLSLTLPFEWSFLVGNSYSLGRIVEIVIGENGFVLERTYPYRVGEEYGWGFDKWHSLFAWLASDITFVGVLLLAPLFSFFYGRLWVGAVSADNAFSGPLFIFLSLGLVFSFANNQIMHGLAGVFVLFVLVLGWLLHMKWHKPR